MCGSILMKLIIDMWQRCGPVGSYTLVLRMLRAALRSSQPSTRARAFDVLYNLSVHGAMLRGDSEEAALAAAAAEAAAGGAVGVPLPWQVRNAAVSKMLGWAAATCWRVVQCARRCDAASTAFTRVMLLFTCIIVCVCVYVCVCVHAQVCASAPVSPFISGGGYGGGAAGGGLTPPPAPRGGGAAGPATPLATPEPPPPGPGPAPSRPRHVASHSLGLSNSALLDSAHSMSGIPHHYHHTMQPAAAASLTGTMRKVASAGRSTLGPGGSAFSAGGSIADAPPPSTPPPALPAPSLGGGVGAGGGQAQPGPGGAGAAGAGSGLGEDRAVYDRWLRALLFQLLCDLCEVRACGAGGGRQGRGKGRGRNGGRSGAAVRARREPGRRKSRALAGQ